VLVHRAFTAIKDALPKPEEKHRRCIAVDEIKQKMERRNEEGKPEPLWLYLWAARDVDTRRP